ncbi:MAG: gamma-glutamyltransferase [Planctomycetota bacterium]|nr:gamma-glutamyltransferase [Planctomycetota bacterium]
MLLQSSLRKVTIRLAVAVCVASLTCQAPARVDYATYAVAADHELASQAGAEILAAGGNAVDAAVATSFTLSVVRPFSCGIGGGGFMLIHLREDPKNPGRALNVALNYREQAPACMTSDYYEKLDAANIAAGRPDPDSSTKGAHAVAIPGTVAGLLAALERFGTMPREEVLAPAIRAARDGFIADKAYVDAASDATKWIAAHSKAAERFPLVWETYAARGTRAVGDRITSPEQARTLELIAAQGRDVFYRGEIARAIVESITRDGGAMTMADLASFTVSTMEPLATSFGGRAILTFPPPSSGGIVLAQTFATLDARRDMTIASLNAGHDSGTYLHLLAEVSKHAFADRARFLGDPAKVHVPLRELLDRDMLARRAQSLDPTRTFAHDTYGMRLEAPAPAAMPDDHGTSHFSVVDAAGNAVACTETVNLLFGSLLDVRGYGFVLNNQMDDFLTRRGTVNAFGLAQDERNLPAPGKRPLSSMSPTIALDGPPDRNASNVTLVVGASGGPRIISGTLQAALNVMMWDVSAAQAVGLPRMHHQWTPDELELERPLRSGDAEADLKKLGHTITTRGASAVQVIRTSKVEGMKWDAASDPRKGGKPAGK